MFYVRTKCSGKYECAHNTYVHYTHAHTHKKRFSHIIELAHFLPSCHLKIIAIALILTLLFFFFLRSLFCINFLGHLRADTFFFLLYSLSFCHLSLTLCFAKCFVFRMGAKLGLLVELRSSRCLEIPIICCYVCFTRKYQCGCEFHVFRLLEIERERNNNRDREQKKNNKTLHNAILMKQNN